MPEGLHTSGSPFFSGSLVWGLLYPPPPPRVVPFPLTGRALCAESQADDYTGAINRVQKVRPHAGTASSSVWPAPRPPPLPPAPGLGPFPPGTPMSVNPQMPQPGRSDGQSRIALRRIPKDRPEGPGEIGFFLLLTGFLGCGRWGEEKKIYRLTSVQPFPREPLDVALTSLGVQRGAGRAHRPGLN